MDDETPSKLHIRFDTELDAEGVEALIRELAENRARMKPAVPTAVGMDTPVLAQEEALFTVRTLADGGLRIWLRNEGLGWLTFQLTKDERQGLADLLSQEAGRCYTAH